MPDPAPTPTSTSPRLGRDGHVRMQRLDPDTLAALEEQRDFLLRSLDDLEREHEAGDVDDHDYQELKDDYTARAARVIRAVEAQQARIAAARRPRSWRRIVATAAAVVAFAVGAGVLVAQTAGQRQAGDGLTGDIRETNRDRMDEATQLAAGGDLDAAIDIYDDVLADQPDNAEALTFKGWLQWQSRDGAGVTTLIEAVETHPDYAPAHAFMAMVLAQTGRTDAALQQLDRLDGLDPPPDIRQLAADLRAQLEAQTDDGPGPQPSPGQG